MKSSLDWSIGEVAERFGLETHVLRHWEDVGLLAPARDSAGRRRYGRDDVVRVATVIRSKAAGMSLDQILVLLDADAPRAGTRCWRRTSPTSTGGWRRWAAPAR